MKTFLSVLVMALLVGCGANIKPATVEQDVSTEDSQPASAAQPAPAEQPSNDQTNNDQSSGTDQTELQTIKLKYFQDEYGICYATLTDSANHVVSFTTLQTNRPCNDLQRQQDK